jgi:hypothetical protein
VSQVLTLGEILGRQLRLEWHEAVAVGRGLIAAIQPVDPARASYASLDEILLSDAGELKVHGHSFNADVSRWVASVLQAVLAKSEPPVQLRLLAMQAAAEGLDLAHLDESLAYFERPNRPVVLQALFARAAAAAPDALAPVPVLQVPERPGAQRRAEAAPRADWPRAFKIAVAATIVIGLSGTAAWFTYTRRDSLPTADSAAASRVADVLGVAMLAGMSKVTETAGLGRLVPPDAVPSPPPASAITARDIPLPGSGRRSGSGGTGDAPDVPEIAAFDLAAVPNAVIPPPAVVEVTADTGAAEGSAAPDVLVYAEGSPGIAPPIGIRPQLARSLPATVRQEDLTPLELVIGTDGSIESVRLIAPPKNVIESMIVSVAKAWQFEPALKDGKPVRYRKTIWIRTR